MSARVCVLSNLNIFNTDHLITNYIALCISFFIFLFMTFTFDTAGRIFQVLLRDGEFPPVGGMENFAVFFLNILGGRNLRRSEFHHFNLF